MLDFKLIRKILEEKESLSDEELKLYNIVKLVIKRDELSEEYNKAIQEISKELQELMTPVEETK